MGFTVTVLGSSGVFSTPERASSGYLVEAGGKHLWLDAGSGTWRNLLTRIDYRDIDGVVLTHRHPDHTSDVWQAVHALKYGEGPRPPRPPLWTTSEAADALLAFAETLAEAFAVERVVPGDTVDFHGATISFHEMDHVPGTVGVRIDHDGGTFAYSSDGGPGGEFQALAEGADVFVCEATYAKGGGGWPGHLTTAEAGQLAERLGVKRLVLTHLKPGLDHDALLAEAKDAAPEVSIELAYDGLTMEVG